MTKLFPTSSIRQNFGILKGGIQNAALEFGNQIDGLRSRVVDMTAGEALQRGFYDEVGKLANATAKSIYGSLGKTKFQWDRQQGVTNVELPELQDHLSRLGSPNPKYAELIDERSVRGALGRLEGGTVDALSRLSPSIQEGFQGAFYKSGGEIKEHSADEVLDTILSDFNEGIEMLAKGIDDRIEALEAAGLSEQEWKLKGVTLPSGPADADSSADGSWDVMQSMHVPWGQGQAVLHVDDNGTVVRGGYIPDPYVPDPDATWSL